MRSRRPAPKTAPYERCNEDVLLQSNREVTRATCTRTEATCHVVHRRESGWSQPSGLVQTQPPDSCPMCLRPFGVTFKVLQLANSGGSCPSGVLKALQRAYCLSDAVDMVVWFWGWCQFFSSKSTPVWPLQKRIVLTA